MCEQDDDGGAWTVFARITDTNGAGDDEWDPTGFDVWGLGRGWRGWVRWTGVGGRACRGCRSARVRPKARTVAQRPCSLATDPNEHGRAQAKDATCRHDGTHLRQPSPHLVDTAFTCGTTTSQKESASCCAWTTRPTAPQYGLDLQVSRFSLHPGLRFYCGVASTRPGGEAWARFRGQVGKGYGERWLQVRH